MDVFDVEAELVRRYQSFARSFTTVRAGDLKSQIDAIYDRGDFWPEPLIGRNLRYLDGPTIDHLAIDGAADPALAEVFALGEPRTPIRLFRHQEQAFHKAQAGKNYVVTTGTGPGKSLCLFLPIIDRVRKDFSLRSTEAAGRQPRRPRPIIKRGIPRPGTRPANRPLLCLAVMRQKSC